MVVLTTIVLLIQFIQLMMNLVFFYVSNADTVDVIWEGGKWAMLY